MRKCRRGIRPCSDRVYEQRADQAKCFFGRWCVSSAYAQSKVGSHTPWLRLDVDFGWLVYQSFDEGGIRAANQHCNCVPLTDSVCSFQQHLAVEKLADDASQRPQVCSVIVRVHQDHFRSAVPPRANVLGLCCTALPLLPRQPKINNLDAAVCPPLTRA